VNNWGGSRIRIGDAKTGWVKYLPRSGRQPEYGTGERPEFVTVDRHGSVFGGTRPRVLRKYVKVR
jgi:hypothetical protein